MQVKSYSDYETWALKKRVLCYAHCDLTYQCNLRCIHCYLNKSSKKRILSANEIESVLNELAKENIVDIGFSGGEIFTRKDILSIIDYAAAKQFRIRLKTNGTLITRSIAENLSKNKCLFQIDVTLLGGTSKRHDCITQHPGSFRDTIKGIKMLCDYLPPRMVVLVYTAMKDNYGDVLMAKKIADGFGCELKLLIPQISLAWPGAATNPEVHRMNIYEKVSYLLTRDAVYSDNYGLGKAISNSRPGNQSRRWEPSKYICSAGRSAIYIDPYGDVYPCVDIKHIYLGNLLKSKLHDIWKKKTFNGFLHKELPTCRRCPFSDSCGACPAANYAENGAFRKPSLEMCEATIALHALRAHKMQKLLKIF